MRIFGLLILLTSSQFFGSTGHAHDEATYLGNSAVLVQSGDNKILYDPFFHNDFGIYRLVPEGLRQAVFKGTPPYDGIDAIIISHAHTDHFDAKDVINYLSQHQDTQLFAPQQAVAEILALNPAETIRPRLHGFALNFGDQPQSMQKHGILVEAVRIPHAGWPSRKDIENIVFRVTLNGQLTSMHMGDADPDDDHYLPFKRHWQARRTDVNLPPFWFFMSAEGRDILNEILNAEQHIGVHVPWQVPKYLLATGEEFFANPGEKRQIPSKIEK